jgi:hypothetical protein
MRVIKTNFHGIRVNIPTLKDKSVPPQSNNKISFTNRNRSGQESPIPMNDRSDDIAE